MVDLVPPFRRATPDDSGRLAEFVNMAGEGLPLYLWSRMAKAGEDPWEIGRLRAMREEGSFSYRNAIMVEDAREVVACLIGYALPEAPSPIDYRTMPPMFVPLQELENLAPATWYVNVLASRPEHRGKGHGRRLLALADDIAVHSGLSGLSIIVSDANLGARRLYRRCGYREIAARRKVKEGWPGAGEDWLLLVKQI